MRQVQDKSVEGIVDIYVVEESGFVGDIQEVRWVHKPFA